MKLLQALADVMKNADGPGDGDDAPRLPLDVVGQGAFLVQCHNDEEPVTLLRHTMVPTHMDTAARSMQQHRQLSLKR